MLPRPRKELSELPPHSLLRVAADREKARASGLDIIELAMGNPDLPPPAGVVARLCEIAGNEPLSHRYSSVRGTAEFRRAAASWYLRKFGVKLDPDSEVLPLIGSKEGMAHLYFAYCGPGDYVLATTPAYPSHHDAVRLTGAELRFMPITEKNDFLPDFGKIPRRTADRAKMLILNYPNNPTGAVLRDDAAFREALQFASKRKMLVLHDFTYSEITFDGYKAPSFLSAPGAKKAGIEYHSLSKSYSVPGWRVGFAAGNAEIISVLAKIKSYVDYGVPAFILKAATFALEGPDDRMRNTGKIYQSRRDALVGSFRAIGWNVPSPKGSMYIWAKLPEKAAKMGSRGFCSRLLLAEGVCAAPGEAFGPGGEGYIRFSLVSSEARIREAAVRTGRFLERLKI